MFFVGHAGSPRGLFLICGESILIGERNDSMDDDAAVRRLPDGGGAVDRSSTRAGFGGANYHKRAGVDAGGSTRAGDTEGVNAGTAGEAAAAKSGFPLDEFTEFSAVMVGSMQPHDDREGYVYRSGNLLRSEGPMEKGYYITDLTHEMTYGQTKMGCVKVAHAYFRSWPFIASRPGHTSERVAVGKETVDGRVCQVEDVTVSGKDIPVATKLRFWEPEEWKGFPIRVEDLNSKGSRVVRFKEVVLGPQDPTLFIYPEDCGRLPEGPTKKSAMTPKVKPSAGRRRQAVRHNDEAVEGWPRDWVSILGLRSNVFGARAIRRWLCLVCWCASTAAAGTPAPNILLITLDTTRADRMGFLGSKRGLTPNLDGLASQVGGVYARLCAGSADFSFARDHSTGTYPQFHQVLRLSRCAREGSPVCARRFYDLVDITRRHLSAP